MTQKKFKIIKPYFQKLYTFEIVIKAEGTMIAFALVRIPN